MALLYKSRGLSYKVEERVSTDKHVQKLGDLQQYFVYKACQLGFTLKKMILCICSSPKTILNIYTLKSIVA